MRCKYCFANDFVDPEKGDNPNLKKNIDIDDFKEIVKFIVQTHSRVGLLGGEPTLHPKINEMMDHLIINERIKAVTVFTNGVYMERVIRELSYPKIRLLVNMNSPVDIGNHNYNKIIKNIESINSAGMINKVLFGINMYKPGFDHDYLIDILKKYDKKNVRVAIIGPNSEEMRRSNYLDYCRQMKPSILEFFKKLYKLGISPRFDCSANVFPPCVLAKEEREFMKEFNDFIGKSFILAGGQKKLVSNVANLVSFPQCEPIIDFTIDKKVIRCFPMYNEKLNMADFKNAREIEGYFRNKYDVFKCLIPIDESCRKCRHMKTMACQGGCIAYRLNEMSEARKKMEEVHRMC